MDQTSKDPPELFRSREAHEYLQADPRPKPIQEHELVGLSPTELRILLKKRGILN